MLLETRMKVKKRNFFMGIGLVEDYTLIDIIRDSNNYKTIHFKIGIE